MKTATVALALLLAAGVSGAASAKEKISFATNVDPSHDAMTYALRNGKVASETVDLDIHLLDINALDQAATSKRFDIIEQSNLAIPRASTQGLQMKIVGITSRLLPGDGYSVWVKTDSPLKTPEDLKGKTVGTFSLGSSAVTLIRIALSKRYGLNVMVNGGDFSMKEMTTAALPAALATDKVDAAMLSNIQAYQVSKSHEFRSLVNGAKIDIDLFGVRPVSSVLTGFPERLDAKRDAYREALRLLRASRDYAIEHQDEVFGAVGEQDHVDPAFFKTWITEFYEFPITVAPTDAKALDLIWQFAKEVGILKETVPAAGAIWDGVLRE